MALLLNSFVGFFLSIAGVALFSFGSQEGNKFLEIMSLPIVVFSLYFFAQAGSGGKHD